MDYKARQKHKPGRNDVCLFTNAPGGPRIIGKNDNARIDEPTEDGNNPNFEFMKRPEAEQRIRDWHGAQRDPAQIAAEKQVVLDSLVATVHEYRNEVGLPPIPVDLHDDPELARHDKAMLGAIIPFLKDSKPITPAQKRYLEELADRYRDAGTPLPPDIIDAWNNYAVQGSMAPAKWPTLADHLIHTKVDSRAMIGAKLSKTLNGYLETSEKIVLSARACERIAEAFKAWPEQVVINGQFAIPPFENCWIEYPNRVMANVLGLQLSDDADERTGFLFRGNRVYVAAQGGHLKPAWTPVMYELNCNPLQARLAEEMNKIGGSREDIDTFYWGAPIGVQIDSTTRMALRAQHGFRCIIPTGEGWLPLGTWRGLASDLPCILSILLTLATPSKQVLQYKEVEQGRAKFSFKGKAKLHAHRIVTIDLDRAPGVRLLTMETDLAREKRTVGWHTVRGHFVHDKRYHEVRRSGACDHGGQGGDWWCEYEPYRWECLHCGSKRTWRTYPNGRGDKSKPVEHHYHV